MKKFTGNPSLSHQQFVQDAPYFGILASEPAQASRWKKNLNNVVWHLERAADKYLSGLDAFNAHKHGLRTMTGTAILNISRQDEAGQRRGVGWSILSDDTLTYLDWQPAGPDAVNLTKVTKFFSPKECFFYLTVLYQMAETIKTTRLAALREDTSPQRINTFFDLDRRQVLQYSEIREWTFPIWRPATLPPYSPSSSAISVSSRDLAYSLARSAAYPSGPLAGLVSTIASAGSRELMRCPSSPTSSDCSTGAS
jgi:hypothetical protein